jgi:hypothetical protein
MGMPANRTGELTPRRITIGVGPKSKSTKEERKCLSQLEAKQCGR